LDATIYKTANNVKHYLYVVRDNFSRAILGCKASLQYNSEQARNTLEEVLTKYNLLHKEGTLITDGGPENKGALTDMLAKPGMLWKKLVAQVDIIQSNSMVEAANKILKYQYLFVQNIADTQAFENILPATLNDYNNRPQYLLTCYTPNEALAGAIPDKQRFKQAIDEEKKKRTEANRKVACDNTC